jgi:hypothetical protein
MGFYHGLLPTIVAVCPSLLSTRAANLAPLMGAILARRTLSLTDLARA